MMGMINIGVTEAVGAVVTAAKEIKSLITGKLSPQEEAAIAAKLQDAESTMQQLQAGINQVEASNPNLFISGWRPAVGWVCVFALAWHYIVFPFIVWIVELAGIHSALPKLQTAELVSLLVALLGLGGYRTAEKIYNVEARH